MKERFVFMLAACLFLSISLSEAKSLKLTKKANIEKVMDAYFKAIGGRKKLDQIKDITVTSKISNPEGVLLTVVKQINEPDRLIVMTENYMNDFLVSKMISTPENLTVISPKGTRKIDGEMAKIVNQQSAALIECAYPVVGVTPTLEGIEPVDGKDAYKVKAVYGQGVFYSFYDCKSGLKVKIVVPGSKGDSEIKVGDYRLTDGGILFAHRLVNTNVETKSMTVTEIQNIKTNQGLKVSDFK